MNTIEEESERKWLVESLPEDLPDGNIIRQHYLSVSEEREVRVRCQDGTYTLGIKMGPRKEKRDELEIEISRSQFRELREAAAGSVRKIRYDFGGGMTADDFIDRDLILLEIEDSEGGKMAIETACQDDVPVLNV